MTISVEQAIKGIGQIVGANNIITGREDVSKHGGWMTRIIERSFGYEAELLPICVATVLTKSDVSAILKYCNSNDLQVIVKAGGSSTEDHLLAITERTVLVNCAAMDQLIELDEYNMMATVGCGMPLATLEKLANEKGLTTGHCPQSIDLAQMGGLVATRSIGQFSNLYGAIEDMVCGLEAIMPDGEVVHIRNVPRRAAGPDLRQLFIGSEGAFAFITQVTVKLFKFYPNDFWKGCYIADSFDKGVDIIRDVITSGFKPSVVRLYDKPDMDTHYSDTGMKPGEVCIFFVAEGPRDITSATGKNIEEIAMAYSGVRGADVAIVDHWLATRNNVNAQIVSGELQKLIKSSNIAAYTLEISASWSQIKTIYKNVMEIVPKKIPSIFLLGGHVSHSYQNGTNIYFVYRYKPASFSDVTENEGWEIIKAICDEVLKESTGGIVHHHGAGKIRAKMLKEELGSSYVLMEKLKDMFDPNNTMNPGVLLPYIAKQ